MLVLCIRTDKPVAELYVYKNDTQVAVVKWEAHRMLADSIHRKIEEVLTSTGSTINDLERIVIFKGPGSFTGLRIGFSVVNAIGYSQDIPVFAVNGDDWIEDGLASKKDKFEPVHPVYGNAPHITIQKK